MIERVYEYFLGYNVGLWFLIYPQHLANHVSIFFVWKRYNYSSREYIKQILNIFIIYNTKGKSVSILFKRAYAFRASMGRDTAKVLPLANASAAIKLSGYQSLSFLGSTNNNTLRYGGKIILEHDFTGRSLASDGHQYTHSESSFQKRVFCSSSLQEDDSDEWIAVPIKQDRSIQSGQTIYLGNRIRLLHNQTRAFLHTHIGYSSPNIRILESQEVTCFGLCDDTIDTTDMNDEWIVLAYEPDFVLLDQASDHSDPLFNYNQKYPSSKNIPWMINQPVCFYHPATKAFLVSNFESIPFSMEEHHQIVYAISGSSPYSEQHAWRVLGCEAAALNQIPRQLLGTQGSATWPDYFDELQYGSVRFGYKITFRHVLTWASLHSHNLNYTHMESSGLQQVTGYTGLNDGNDFWIILPAEPCMSGTTLPGEPVLLGHPILIKHASTGKYLATSSEYKSSHGGLHQEVFCQELNSIYSIPSERFIWIVQMIESTSEESYWKKNATVQLRHQSTQVLLHSNFIYFFVNDNDRQQEIYGWKESGYITESIIEDHEGSIESSESNENRRDQDIIRLSGVPSGESSLQYIMRQLMRELTNESVVIHMNNEAPDDIENTDTENENIVSIERMETLLSGSSEGPRAFIERNIATRRLSGDVNDSRDERNNEWKITYSKPASIDQLPTAMAGLVTASFYEHAPPCY